MRAPAAGAALALLALGACGETTTTLPVAVDAAPTPDASAPPDQAAAPFRLTSPAFQDQGTLPTEFTCDGIGHSPPLSWSGTPPATKQLALLMTTQAKDGLKWNWVLFGVPAGVTQLPTGAMGVGTAGLTSDGPNLAYSPPCSLGPGAKSYTFTLYALSDAPTLPAQPREVTGAVLTAAIANLVVAQGALTVSYTR